MHLGVNFKVGDEITSLGRKGKIISNTLSNKQYYAVEFEDGSVERVYYQDIITQSMENDWKEVSDKIAQATNLLHEAQDLAKNKSRSLMSANTQGLINLYGIFDILDQAGWQTSSLNC